MRIQQDELLIRSAAASDAEQLTAWWNDGAVMAHAGFPNGLGQSREETLRQIARNEAGLSQRCIIEIGGALAGEMNYRLAENEAEIGIKICEAAYQNRGFGSRLLAMLIQFMFTDRAINEPQKLEKICLDTNLRNERAQHVYEKLGFDRLRVNENAWRDQLGAWQSSVDYEMTRTAWYKRYVLAPYWSRFLAATGRAPETPCAEHYFFCLDAYWADALLKLVLDGKKRATTSSARAYELDGTPLPRPSDLAIITDWVGIPGCVAETTAVTRMRFRDMTFDIASREGEDEALDTWRDGHIRFFTDEGREMGYAFDEDMQILFEDFEVIYRE